MDQQGNLSMQDAMRLASTPAGQQLIAMLRRQNSADLEKAMEKASSGDYSGAKSALSALLSDPNVIQLLKSLEGK